MLSITFLLGHELNQALAYKGAWIPYPLPFSTQFLPKFCTTLKFVYMK